MTRYQVTLTMGPVPWVYARVFRSRGMKVPVMSSPRSPGALIPLRLRSLHKAWAQSHHYFWLPCILCGREYGGHEVSDSISDPTYIGREYVICPFCTIRRNARLEKGQHAG